MDRVDQVLQKAQAKLQGTQVVPPPTMSLVPGVQGLMDYVNKNKPAPYVPFPAGTPTLSGNQFALQEAQTTGYYAPPELRNTLDQIQKNKQLNQTIQDPAARQRVQLQNHDLYGQLQSRYGIDGESLFNTKDAKQNALNMANAYRGVPTMQKNLNDWQKTVQEAGLTGMYNGQPTADQAYRNASLGLDQQRLALQQAAQNFDNNMTIWKSTGAAPAGIPGVDPGTPIFDAETPKISKTALNSEIDKRILQAAQMNRENPGTEGMMGFIKNQIIPDIPQMMDMGLGIKDINSIIDRTVNAFTNGQFKTKKEYYDWLKENMGEDEFNKWKKENDFQLNFNESAKGGGYDNYWKIQREASKAPSRVNEAANAIQQALKDTGTPSSWLTPMLEIAGRESTWDPTSQNSNSTAYGMFQFLNSTWKGTGINKTSDPYKQAVAAVKYIKGRYGTPENALKYWDQHNYY